MINVTKQLALKRKNELTSSFNWNCALYPNVSAHFQNKCSK